MCNYRLMLCNTSCPACAHLCQGIKNPSTLKMKKYTLITAFFLFATFTVQAQPYNRAIGVRAGWSNGFTYKHFFSESSAFEGIVYSRWRGLQITGLIEKHVLARATGFDWYYGAGAHIGFWRGYEGHPWFRDKDYNRSYTTIGIDGIIGIEYTFQGAPFNLSLDYKPSFELYGYTGFWGGDAAFSVRYCF